MKIIHVIDQISQTKHGGSAVVPYQLGKAQAKLGHDVTIFASDYDAKDQAAPEGVKLVKFKTVCSYQSLRVTPGMMTKDYSKFDIVHLHNYRTIVNFMALEGIYYGNPIIILQAHGNAAPLPWNHWIKPIAEGLWRYGIFNRCSYYLADADFEIEHYLKEGAPANKIGKLQVGINLDEYKDLPVKVKSEYKTILFLGRLDKIKGIDILIDAFARLNRQDVRLVIAGPDYGCEQRLRLRTEWLGVNGQVSFTGAIYGNHKIEMLANADVFVMPSRYEMWGLTFVEALACGTPVILSENCGGAEKIKAHHPLGCVAKLDADSLALAINTMLDNGFADIPAYREYRQKWATKYSWDSIAERSIDIYKELVVRRCYTR
jgi:glycosyltransferase involved in cell wall biosynthesis